MNFITFLFLILTFPYWFPIAAAFFIGIGGIWIIGYPIACTVHLPPGQDFNERSLA